MGEKEIRVKISEIDPTDLTVEEFIEQAAPNFDGIFFVKALRKYTLTVLVAETTKGNIKFFNKNEYKFHKEEVVRHAVHHRGDNSMTLFV